MAVRILFVGEGRSIQYVDAFYEASKKMPGISAHIIREQEYYDKIPISLIRRFEKKTCVGYMNRQINMRLRKITRNDTDIVFLYAARSITPKTVKILVSKGIWVACYNNDDIFSDYYPKYYFRHSRAVLRFCNMNYVYRASNIAEARHYRSINNQVLMPYYINNRNYYISDDRCNEIDYEVPEVIFLGHMEQDERKEYMKALINEGLPIGVSEEWVDFEPNHPLVTKLTSDPGKYNEILNKAKIAIVFLSKINHDTYTRRCFEIPATKTMMLAPYTEDLAAMFAENKEAVYYRNKEEFVGKTQYYLNHPAEREAIGEAGFQRLMRDGHEAGDRVRQIIGDYYDLRGDSM